jgi:hypothetical protein
VGEVYDQNWELVRAMKTSRDAENDVVGTNEVSGNVRISISPRGLIVTIPATRTTSSIIIPGLLCAFILYKSGEIVHGLVDFRGIKASVLPIFVFLIFLWMIFQLFQLLFGHREVLRCVDDELEITNFDFGYAWRRRCFFRGDIKHFEFATVGFSKYDGITGLRFSAAGKQIKCLRDLASVEASKILNELKNLGFDTKTDVATPMMVEIEESKRKSFWG